MRRICGAIWVICLFTVRGEVTFVTDPTAPGLRTLAQPFVLDETVYGCGPLQTAGQTYHVGLTGSDEADGRTWDTAWRTLGTAIPRLQAGDTLLIGEGEYCEYLQFGGDKALAGEPGRPIRIMAAPRARVVISAARRIGPFLPCEGRRYTCRATAWKPRNMELYTGLWEADSRTVLEPAPSPAAVETSPGTYHFHQEEEGKQSTLYVRFSNGRTAAGRFVYLFRHHRGLVIGGRYVLVRGIRVKHAPFYGIGVRGHHITVEDCAVFANWGCGIYLGKGARWNLIRNNYGYANEDRGTIRSNGETCTDNVYIGNHCDPSPPSGRSGRRNQEWCINNYGGIGARCHVIDNLLNDGRSCRWKPAVRGAIFEGNVCVGQVHCTGTDRLGWTDPGNCMVLRNNTIRGSVSWGGEAVGPNGFNGNWVAPDKASLNNIVANSDSEAVAAARFADPAWLDYRLQSDSPFRGNALGGGDRGAFRYCRDRILYVGPAGSDEQAGTSERLAFRTLAKACSTLQAGDTLYVMPGDYAEILRIEAAGTAARPIKVRPYQRAQFELPGIVVTGAHVQVEGFAVASGAGNGIEVRADHVRVVWCLVHHMQGAGLFVVAAREVTVNHCTLADNARGLVLSEGAAGATLRNSIAAQNTEVQIAVDAETCPGFRIYNTCRWGAGSLTVPAAVEVDCIAADPSFADPAAGDYRLAWDSPARYLGEFHPPAGSAPALTRPVEVGEVAAVNIQRESAVVTWTTPADETIGRARVQETGTDVWIGAKSTQYGTRHAVGVVGLKPGTVYQYYVEAAARGNRQGRSARGTFRTPLESRLPGTLYVSPEGDNQADGRTPQSAWASVRQACVQAIPGDIVRIAPGAYADPIAPVATGLPDQRITFQRWGDGEVVLDGGQTRACLCDLDRRSHVTIDGITFQTAVPKGWPPALIHIGNGRDVAILNCRTRRLTGRACAEAVCVDRFTGLRIEGNVFSGQRYNIRAYRCSDLTIRNNTFANHGVMAFAFRRVTGCRIENNLFFQTQGRGNPYIDFRVEPGDSELSLDYNLYTPAPRMFVVHIRELLAGGRVATRIRGDTLEGWQQASGQDGHSLWVDPQLLAPERGDFRLQPDSPARGAGRDGGDIGALGVAP